MPNWSGQNTKAQEAHARRAAAEADRVAAVAVKKENELWKDDDKKANAKTQRKTEMNAKHEDKLAKKAELRKLIDAEEQAAKSSSKAVPTTKKLTQAQIAARALLMSSSAAAPTRPSGENNQDDMPLHNLNHLRMKERLDAQNKGEHFVDASGLDEAVLALSTDDPGVDLHPEKRMKAAFKAYEEEMMRQLRTENPTLKRSQLMDLLWKQWKKAPENPLNQQ